MFLYIALAPLALFTAFRCFHLFKNYTTARRFNIPIILLPVSCEDIWWIPLRPLFSWVERLPLGLGSWYVYTEMGWPMVDGNKTVLRVGENFVLCSPGSNQLVTCYPPALSQTFRDHKHWAAPEAQAQIFAFYGQNVSSTNGAEWRRHRKITASAFNENSMHRVWDESVKRVAGLDLGGESDRTLGRIRSTFDLFAMHVLAVVGFGQENAALTEVPPGHRESLMDSLGFILKNITLTLVFNGLKAPDFLLPNVLQRLKVSVAEFRLYMQELVLQQMQLSSEKEKGQSQSTSLLEALITANEAEKQQLQAPTARPSYLTESELYGNLFVFNLAGYETTAGAMTFALPFLAAHPDMQDWVIEEVDAYYRTSSDGDYASTYSKLVRCLAVLYETLRLANPAPLLLWSPTTTREFPVMTKNGSASITVPPGTMVGMHNYGAHLSPRWGADAQGFNPKRFISASASTSSSTPDKTRFQSERLVVPESAAYIPWTAGPRICPGKKFSEVEFVATIVKILSEYRIEVLKVDGESDVAAKERLMAVLEERFFNISAHLKRPEDAGVRFVRRGK